MNKVGLGDNEIEFLQKRIRDKRQSDGLSIRNAAKEIGMPWSTLDQIERGRIPQMETFFKLFKWLGLADGATMYRPSKPMVEIVRELLNQDKNLTKQNRAALLKIFVTSYEVVTLR